MRALEIRVSLKKMPTGLSDVWFAVQNKNSFWLHLSPIWYFIKEFLLEWQVFSLRPKKKKIFIIFSFDWRPGFLCIVWSETSGSAVVTSKWKEIVGRGFRIRANENSFIHSFIYSFIHSFIPSIIHSIIHSFIQYCGNPWWAWDLQSNFSH